MKTNQWAKTLLHVYKYLDRIAGAIDKIVDKKALNTFFYSHNQKEGVLESANEIIELSERKKRIINLKVLTDKCLQECSEENARILINRFIDNDSAETTAKRMNFLIRTLFRKQEFAEGQFYANMIRQGFDDKTMREYIADEKWIMEVYNFYQHQFEEDKKNAKLRANQKKSNSNHSRQIQNNPENESL